MIRAESTTLLLAISIVEDIMAIAALGVIQSIAEQSVSEIGIGGSRRSGITFSSYSYFRIDSSRIYWNHISFRIKIYSRNYG